MEIKPTIAVYEEETKLNGTGDKILAGLSCVIYALRNNGFPEKEIKQAIEIGFKLRTPKEKEITSARVNEALASIKKLEHLKEKMNEDKQTDN